MAQSKKKRRRKVTVLVLVALVIAGAIWHFRARGEEPVAVQVETVAPRDITELVLANGRIHPVVRVVINPEVSGEIVELPVKDGQRVEKGDLLVRIKPDNYIASTESADAAYQAALAAIDLARANRDLAEANFKRSEQLFSRSFISESEFAAERTALAIARANLESSIHHCAQAKAALDRTRDDLAKTTLVSPIAGTVTKLLSQVGERVVGSITMAGTEIMTIADLNEMEARVEIGEIDIVLIEAGQVARLEVDAFRDRKFSGVVTDIANSAGGSGGQPGQQQEGTRFEVKIRLNEQESFRPGMSVSAEVETRSRTGVLAVPIQSVTTRMPAGPADSPVSENSPSGDSPSETEEEERREDAPASDAPRRAVEVVFVAVEGFAKMLPVTRGISNDTHVEIVEGVTEGQQVISGGFRAINRELEHNKRIRTE